MRIPRLFVNTELASGHTVALDADASRYLAGVLRMEAGRPLTVFNGKGGEYAATIASAAKKAVTLTIGAFDPTEKESPLAIHLGIGLSKGDRFDWVIQKATELGVTHITPLLTSRSEVKLSAERADKKIAHWQQIAVSACEQCQRNRLPVIAAPLKLDQWLADRSEALKLVLHHRADRALSTHATPTSVAMVIGPEGGLSDEEIAQAQDQGFHPLQLGPRVLRTETAPIAALSILQMTWGDFQ
ncbi:16S rRNA (uracil(1498)-N(3))-methyltransferase [Simiduia agarivorans]|uniref:Ribosomal RNA small subunit methyltransferase E n=1 Tax=Simiduia agarivorans (strain DSM 21679 / JCM 13881 / BCRC 17597 / SA1) TaxID=1117647 RepID=K4KNQ6_SIMAS|nr:16S rRNA (uracil(1498)-N(3))-methyltransferase [Simiduia agarivorans]AFU99875.1 16S rRNA m3U1498 methyltransferase [Simiduia agarivorans SA1 = DSM 21679]